MKKKEIVETLDEAYSLVRKAFKYRARKEHGAPRDEYRDMDDLDWKNLTANQYYFAASEMLMYKRDFRGWVNPERERVWFKRKVGL